MHGTFKQTEAGLSEIRVSVEDAQKMFPMAPGLLAIMHANAVYRTSAWDGKKKKRAQEPRS
jgi:hypothetical protein